VSRHFQRGTPRFPAAAATQLDVGAASIGADADWCVVIDAVAARRAMNALERM